jgi:hypothetical protein
MQTVLRLPTKPAQDGPGAKLAEILHESAYLLQASRDSQDAEVRDAAIDLAVRSLKAASLALTPAQPRDRRPVPAGRVIKGPWGPVNQSSSS